MIRPRRLTKVLIDVCPSRPSLPLVRRRVASCNSSSSSSRPSFRIAGYARFVARFFSQRSILVRIEILLAVIELGEECSSCTHALEAKTEGRLLVADLASDVFSRKDDSRGSEDVFSSLMLTNPMDRISIPRIAYPTVPNYPYVGKARLTS